MTSRTQIVDLDAWFANVNGNSGNGNGKYMGVGKGTSAWAWQNRCAVRLSRGSFFDGIPNAAAITGFWLNLKASNAVFGIGSGVKLYADRGTSAFTELQLAVGAHNVTNVDTNVLNFGPASGLWPGPSTDTANRGSWTGSPANNGPVRIDLLALGRWWYAQTSTTLVVVLSAQDEADNTQRCTFWTKDSTSKPYFEIEFGGNSPPAKPANVKVVNGSDGTSFTVTADYSDPNGDPSTRWETVFTPDATT